MLPRGTPTPGVPKSWHYHPPKLKKPKPPQEEAASHYPIKNVLAVISMGMKLKGGGHGQNSASVQVGSDPNKAGNTYLGST